MPLQRSLQRVKQFQYYDPYCMLRWLFTYNHMAQMSLRIRSNIKESMVLTRAKNCFRHVVTYIKSLLNNN